MKYEQYPCLHAPFLLLRFLFVILSHTWIADKGIYHICHKQTLTHFVWTLGNNNSGKKIPNPSCSPFPPPPLPQIKKKIICLVLV